MNYKIYINQMGYKKIKDNLERFQLINALDYLIYTERKNNILVIQYDENEDIYIPLIFGYNNIDYYEEFKNPKVKIR